MNNKNDDEEEIMLSSYCKHIESIMLYMFCENDVKYESKSNDNDKNTKITHKWVNKDETIILTTERKYK